MRELNKYFVFSDVHGEYKALQDALNEAGYDRHNPNHKLISCGDNFDRGPESAKIYRFLRDNKAICVRGNHDNFLIEYLEKGMDGEFVLFNILHNGLGATIKSFTGLNDDVFNVNNIDQARRNISSDLLKWLKNMPLYFETSTFIFVHAGLNPWIRNWKETDEHYMTWDIKDSHRSIPNINKFCVIGHHHASKVRANGIAEGCGDYNINDATYSLNWEPDDNRGRSYRIKSYGNTDENRPYINGNKIAIDGMTNLTGKVNVLVIEDYPLEDPNPTQESNKPQEPDLSSNNIKVNYPNFGEVTYATTGPTEFTYRINVDEPMFYENITTTTWRG